MSTSMSICELVYPVVIASVDARLQPLYRQAVAGTVSDTKPKAFEYARLTTFPDVAINLSATRLKNSGGWVGLSKKRDDATQKATRLFKNRHRFRESCERGWWNGFHIDISLLSFRRVVLSGAIREKPRRMIPIRRVFSWPVRCEARHGIMAVPGVCRSDGAGSAMKDRRCRFPHWHREPPHWGRRQMPAPGPICLPASALLH